MVISSDFDAGRQYFHTLRLTSELVDLRVGNAAYRLRYLAKRAAQSKVLTQQNERCKLIASGNTVPTGYTPCEHAFGVGATHPASPRDALTEQSARGSLVQAQTRSRLIMQPPAQTGRFRLEAWYSKKKKPKSNHKGSILTFLGGPSRTRTQDRPVMSRQL